MYLWQPGLEVGHMKAVNRETEDQRIGKLIRILRHKAKLSQTELGKALDVSFQQIQKYEKGTNRVASSTLPAISEALGVSPSYFFEKHKADANFGGGDALGLLADKRAHRMLTAFSNISSNKMKDAILELVEMLSAKEQSRSS
jgi:transcriptional regulator with XRE-family HTH domain